MWPIETENLLAALSRLAAASRAIRSLVVYPRGWRYLKLRAEVFNAIVGALDAIDDTTFALIAYVNRLAVGAETDKAEGYLVAYGVLHSLYLQQDSVFWCCKHLRIDSFVAHSEPRQWVDTLPAVREARIARNDSTGHPIHRKGTKSVFFISHHSLDQFGFELMEAPPSGPSVLRHVSFPNLIAGQGVALGEVLERASESLGALERAHYKEFMDQPLTAILERLGYVVRNLGRDRREEIPMSVAEIRRELGALRGAVQMRHEEFDDHWEAHYRKLDCALGRVDEYAKGTPASVDNDLVDVLCDYVRYALNDLQGMTSEIDRMYLEGGQRS